MSSIKDDVLELYEEFYEIGYNAYQRGEKQAPFSNEDVYAWVEFVNPRVADPRSSAVFRGFRMGWDQAWFDELPL